MSAPPEGSIRTDSEKIIAALLAHIDTLEKTLDVTRGPPQPLNLHELIKWLRLHEIILLQLCDREPELTTEILAKEGIHDGVAGQLWYLSRSGLPAEVIAAFRAAADHGMNKW